MELPAVICPWPSEDVRLEVATRRDVVAVPHSGAISDKTLDTDGRRFSFNISDSWRQLLMNVFQALPVSKVFSSKVLPALAAQVCRQCRHRIGLDSLAQFCGLSLSVPDQQKAGP